MFRKLKILVLSLIALLPLPVQAEGRIELTRMGFAAFKIVTPGGGVLLIDPWLLNHYNPNAVKDFAELGKVDYILISHGHQNAIGDAADIVKKTGARLIVAERLERSLIQNRQFRKPDFLRKTLRPWDSIDILDGEVTVTIVPSRHLGPGERTSEAKMRDNAAYAGAYGFIIEFAHGPTLYHTGDTKFIADFESIGQRRKIDLMMVGLDPRHAMGPEDAAEAVALVRPGMVIPMRYEDAGPEILPNFSRELKATESKAVLRVLRPGEKLAY